MATKVMTISGRHRTDLFFEKYYWELHTTIYCDATNFHRNWRVLRDEGGAARQMNTRAAAWPRGEQEQGRNASVVTSTCLDKMRV